MPRRQSAIALLALTALLGIGGPAEADDATRRAPDVPVEPSLGALGSEESGAGDERRQAATSSVEATLAASAGGALGEAVIAAATTPEALEAWDEATDAGAWAARIEDHIAALHEAARAHAARRSDRAIASATLLERLSTLAAGLHDPDDPDIGLGIAVLDLDTGAPVFEHEAERGLNPASNHKLLTAVAALELLGDDYRWQTRVLRAGDALVLRGEGDPSLQIEDLERLAAEVAAAIDLHEIRRVIVDDTAFTQRRFGPGYDPHGPGVSYMAPSGALSLQWNTVEVRVRGAATGHALPVEISPASEHVELRSSASGGRGSVHVRSWSEGDRTVIGVDGNLRAGASYTKRRRVSDPGRFTGSAFAAMLARRGAAGPLGGHLPVELGPTPTEATPVATHTSAPLPQVLDSALSWSNNFTSEQILRTLGWRMSGEPGGWDNGRRALERYWEAAGLSRHALEFENASGLSANTRISAAALADLLAFAAREGSAAAALWSALPVAGREGTLRGRLRRSGGRVRAKTGTLHDASALSGMVHARGGRRLGFSILVNGPVSPARSRRLQDAVVMALVNYGTTR
jgi:D-alanyl-D-alanine carboxypeptidase/D-alanyl-D-alanine-endopeptidase (penicillin-binding protein 4)